MPRPRSPHVQEVKAALAARLAGGSAPVGGRFLSTRAVAQRFAVSYQTAHRLLAELAAEGLLERKPASGSYVPGARPALQGVHLVFHRRARRKESFGAHLLSLLTDSLAARGVSVARSWSEPDAPARLRQGYYPVCWESPATLSLLARERRLALLLNDRPPPGLAGAFIDAVTTDDFSGGACAAELLRERTGTARRFAVLGGPGSDPRSVQRIAGFQSQLPDATVVRADSWFLEDARRRVPAVLAGNPSGIFACNDRLGQAVIEHCREAALPVPPLVGFDNAPIAERLRLSTIGIPWDAFVACATDIIVTRLNGSTTPARVVTIPHEVIVRLSLPRKD